LSTGQRGMAFVLGQGRRTILLFRLEVRWAASFCLDFFVTFFVKSTRLSNLTSK